MPRRNRDRRRRRGRLVVATGLLLVATGCTERIETDSSRFDLDGIPPQLPPLIAPEVLDERAGRAGLVAEAVPLGFANADGVSPPVVAPNGRFLAVQRAPAPGWVDLVGWRAEMPSPAPAIALIPIEEETGLGPLTVPREPLLLARGATDEGVLVESPRPDGGRRIGLAAWEDGEVEWLVEDDGVAAMATLGADGSLAWCRSERVGDPASLRLLDRDGELREWLPPPESTWMLPSFSGDGSRLFALLLEDGRARLASFDLRNPEAGIETWAFSDRIDAPAALRAVLATGPDASPPGEASWLLLHPEWNALARWHPGEGRIDRLPAGTFAFTARLPSGRILADTDGIWHVRDGLDEAAPRLDLLLEGPWIPRVIRPDVGDDDARLLLLQPDATGFRVIELLVARRSSDDRSGEGSTPRIDAGRAN